MPHPSHYSPPIDRVIVCALYHEARRLRRPMTRLANEFLTKCLRDSESWSIAQQQMSNPDQGTDHEAGAKR